MLPDSVQASEPWPSARLRQLRMNFSQHDLNCWLDCGAVHGGLLLCPATHAPHGPEVEQILSNFMALLAEHRASCDRGFHKGQQGETFQQKMSPKGP
jgi:hypothetical protein